MKSVKILVLVFGLILITSAASFGQIVFTAGSSANQIAPNAQTAAAGSIALYPTSAGTIPAGESMNISYAPYTISSLSDLSVILSTAPACTFTGFTAYGIPSAPQTCGGATVAVTVTLTSVTITVTGTSLTVTPGSGPFIQINGVRLDVAAVNPSVDSTIDAFISSNQGLATTTNPNPTVGIVKEPITLTLTTAAGTVPQVGGSTTAVVTVSEAGSFTNAFETKGATAPTQIKLAVTVPAQFSLTSATLGTIPVTVTAAVASVVGNVVTINIHAQSPSLLESIPVNLTFTGTAPVPLNPGTATVTATLAPPATGAYPYTVNNIASTNSLKYASRPVPSPALVISFGVTQNTTTLYSVFNVWGFGLNTGFAVANPTGKVFGTAQPGSIVVTLYPSDGVSAVKTIDTKTNKTLGLGLDTGTGMLPAGGEWTVLLSDLATAAGLSAFQGQVTFQTNFSDAHGINFISDPAFAVQSQGFPMLVLTSAGLNN